MKKNLFQLKQCFSYSTKWLVFCGTLWYQCWRYSIYISDNMQSWRCQPLLENDTDFAAFRWRPLSQSMPCKKLVLPQFNCTSYLEMSIRYPPNRIWSQTFCVLGVLRDQFSRPLLRISSWTISQKNSKWRLMSPSLIHKKIERHRPYHTDNLQTESRSMW